MCPSSKERQPQKYMSLSPFYMHSFYTYGVILAFLEISLTSDIREIRWIGEANQVAEQ